MVHGEECSRFEEQLRLVEAGCLEEAFLKTRAIGIGMEESILLPDGKTDSRQFVDVVELFPVPALHNGSEIYSQIHVTSEARSYIHQTHQRGMAVRMNAHSN